jgi:hypothetical protein
MTFYSKYHQVAFYKKLKSFRSAEQGISQYLDLVHVNNIASGERLIRVIMTVLSTEIYLLLKGVIVKARFYVRVMKRECKLKDSLS